MVNPHTAHTTQSSTQQQRTSHTARIHTSVSSASRPVLQLTHFHPREPPVLESSLPRSPDDAGVLHAVHAVLVHLVRPLLLPQPKGLRLARDAKTDAMRLLS